MRTAKTIDRCYQTDSLNNVSLNENALLNSVGLLQYSRYQDESTMEKIKKCIYKRGPSSFQVKVVANGPNIKGLSDARTSRELLGRVQKRLLGSNWQVVAQN